MPRVVVEVHCVVLLAGNVLTCNALKFFSALAFGLCFSPLLCPFATTANSRFSCSFLIVSEDDVAPGNCLSAELTGLLLALNKIEHLGTT